MHPTLVVRPVQHAGWVFEEKVDGWRMLALKEGNRRDVKLLSRNGRDQTARFPEIAEALRSLEGNIIHDGEVAIYDRRLISRFEWLRHHAPPDLATPPLFMVFDAPFARNKDLRRQPLYVRRNVIEDVLDGQDVVLPVRRLADDGREAWKQVLAHGWEGLVTKDPQSLYVGGRTLKWLKVKQAKYLEGEQGWEPRTKS